MLMVVIAPHDSTEMVSSKHFFFSAADRDDLIVL
jgi:hypothetical protein